MRWRNVHIQELTWTFLKNQGVDDTESKDW